MKPVVAIQARMSSTRLPGKVLADICGKPMIHRVWDAVESPAWARVVLTTNDPSDDELAEYLREHEILNRAGPLHDVLLRYIEFIRRAKPAILIRACGDAPFLRSSWIFHALEHIEKKNEPAFVPGAIHAGTYDHWMDCFNATPNWVPDREHAGHDWFKDNGTTIDLVPDWYFTVNTQDELERARKLWKEKHPSE